MAGTSNGVDMNTTTETLLYYPARMEALTAVSDGSWMHFEQVDKTIADGNSLDWRELVSFFAQFGDVVARMEFFHWTSRAGEYRGVIFYDNLGSPLVHCRDALLGYDGPDDGPSQGSWLSRKIFERLGVLESDIIEANRRVHPYRYKPVVFSREKTVGDPKRVVIGAPVREYWDWWLTESVDD